MSSYESALHDTMHRSSVVGVKVAVVVVVDVARLLMLLWLLLLLLLLLLVVLSLLLVSCVADPVAAAAAAVVVAVAADKCASDGWMVWVGGARLHCSSSDRPMRSQQLGSCTSQGTT
jgi:hypothetical protein